jgi:hypothetical protein
MSEKHIRKCTNLGQLKANIRHFHLIFAILWLIA